MRKTFSLYPHQLEAIEELRPGSILCGGVGSGKSVTALAYYILHHGGSLEELVMRQPLNLYIITTAKKRDSLEWHKECAIFGLSPDNPDASTCSVTVKVDSWNLLKNYDEVKNAFFIFDEQRVVGSGAWTKHFLKIARNNEWILLTATPGDTWMDYIPVFVANGYYKNRTEFIRRHVVYNRFAKFPMVENFVDIPRLEFLKEKTLVYMDYEKKTTQKRVDILAEYDKEKYRTALRLRWDPFKDRPIQHAGVLCYILRKIVNQDSSRIEKIKEIMVTHPKVIIFYSFDYELEILKTLPVTREYNGHRHDSIPSTDSWAYLVQYFSGSEGWNCTDTDTVIFYSLSYSYKLMTQAAGRIDRLNTPFDELYYYWIYSNSSIDLSIRRALNNKKNFNSRKFASFGDSRKKHRL